MKFDEMFQNSNTFKKIILSSAAAFTVIFMVFTGFTVSTERDATYHTPVYGPVQIFKYPEQLKQAVSHIPENEKPLIALTFDDGPTKSVTNKILDVLEGYGSRATFFIVGNRVVGNEETLKRINETGNEVANHSFSHKQLTKLDTAGMKKELTLTNNAIKKATGVTPALARPTYGAYNEKLLANAGMTLVNWSVDTLDWKERDAQKVSKIIIDNAADGAIVLMHDLYGTTADAVEIAVPKLIEMGYRLVTVSEMFEMKNVKQTDTKVYTSIETDN